MMTFEDLEAWQSARKLTKQEYDLTKTPALVRDFGVTGQIQRASVSLSEPRRNPPLRLTGGWLQCTQRSRTPWRATERETPEARRWVQRDGLRAAFRLVLIGLGW